MSATNDTPAPLAVWLDRKGGGREPVEVVTVEYLDGQIMRVEFPNVELAEGDSLTLVRTLETRMDTGGASNPDTPA